MSFKVINFESINTPKAVENPAKEWVAYGEDNDYFTYLIDRCNGSAVSNAIITSVSDQIYGEGVAATDSDRKPLDFAKMRTIFKGEDIKRVCGDLKKLGMGAFNIIWNKGRIEVSRAKHIPMQNLRPEKSTDGEIKGWYYSDNWKEYRKDRFRPKRIETFTGAKGEESQVLVIAPYSAGFFYFSPVDYVGALPWSEIDEEIANYHKTNIQNGFAPTMLVNFNNGLPEEEEQLKVERAIENKLTGTGGKKWLTSWNDDSSTATTIETIPISEASEQYKFLSEESTQKILIGHKVTSPMLFGIKDASGFGNNADEIKTASQLFDNTVIRPKQNMVIDAIDSVLAVNNIILDLYVKTIQPIEFIETEDLSIEEEEKETGVKMSAIPFLSDELGDELLDELELIGEENNPDEWELMSEDLIDTTKEGFHQFSDPLKSDANPDDKSIYGDVGLYKVRYAYTKTSKKTSSGKSRKFCDRMIELAGGGLEYRFEDIEKMSDKGVNGKFAPKGSSSYSLFKYKGGVNCYHGWMRRIYFRKRDSKGRIMKNEGMKNEKKVGNNPYIVQKGSESTAPIDTPSKGRL